MVEDATIRIRLVIADDDSAGRGSGKGGRRTGDAAAEAREQEVKESTINTRFRGRLQRRFGFADESGAERVGRRVQARNRVQFTSRVAGAVGRLGARGAAQTGIGRAAAAGTRVTGAGALGLATPVAIGALAIGGAAFLAEQVVPLVAEALTTLLEPLIGKQAKGIVDTETRKLADQIGDLTARVKAAFEAIGATKARARARLLIGGPEADLDIGTIFARENEIRTKQRALTKKANRELDREVVRNLTTKAMRAANG